MAFEIALLIFLGVVLVTVIVNVARPVTQAYLEKTKFQAKELGSDAEHKLKTRVEFLEQEVIELKRQITAVQETTEYAVKQIESKQKQDS